MLWRSGYMHIRLRGHFQQGVKTYAGPHGCLPKLNPYVNLISRYLTYIDCSRNGTLNLTKFLCLRFLLYLVYNSYVLQRCCYISDSRTFEIHRSVNLIISTHSSRWKELSLRSFAKLLIDEIDLTGSKVLLREVCGMEISTVSCSPQSIIGSSSNIVTGVEELKWARRNWRTFLDTEPFRSRRFSSSIFYSPLKDHFKRPYVLCTVYRDGRVVGNKH